jgi:hypothetical protein
MHKYTRDATVYTTVTTKAVTIRIKSETHKRLKNFGTLGDTFDSLINKALDCLERERNGGDDR